MDGFFYARLTRAAGGMSAATGLRRGGWAGWLAILAIAWWGALALAQSSRSARPRPGSTTAPTWSMQHRYQFSPAVLEALENGVP